MDAASALADLLEISSHLDAAVLLEGDGSVAASTIPSEAGSERLARAGLELLQAAGGRFASSRLTHVEAALREASIYVLRDDRRTIVARARPQAPSLLVFYDLRACLAAAGAAKPSRRAGGKKVEQAADA